MMQSRDRWRGQIIREPLALAERGEGGREGGGGAQLYEYSDSLPIVSIDEGRVDWR